MTQRKVSSTLPLIEFRRYKKKIGYQFDAYFSRKQSSRQLEKWVDKLRHKLLTKYPQLSATYQVTALYADPIDPKRFLKACSREQEITQKVCLTQLERLSGSSNVPTTTFDPKKRMFTQFHMMVVKK